MLLQWYRIEGDYRVWTNVHSRHELIMQVHCKYVLSFAYSFLFSLFEKCLTPVHPPEKQPIPTYQPTGRCGGGRYSHMNEDVECKTGTKAYMISHRPDHVLPGLLYSVLQRWWIVNHRPPPPIGHTKKRRLWQKIWVIKSVSEAARKSVSFTCRNHRMGPGYIFKILWHQSIKRYCDLYFFW